MKQASRATRGARVGWLCSLLLPVFLIAGASADGAEVNVVRSVKTNQSGEIEIELNSTKEFPVRDAVIELRIGDQTFRRSRPAPDGGLNTIIFVLTDDQYAKINTGDSITVAFSHEPSGWDFGKIDKTRRDK